MPGTLAAPADLPGPVSSPPPGRDAALAALLDAAQLSSPPALALQIVRAASRPDCNPQEIVGLLKQDPALCAKLLKVVNSCVYALSRPVASVNQAVLMLGLNTVRSLVLGTSLPAMRPNAGRTDGAMREFWVASFSGALLARELAVRLRRPCPDDDMVAGLLRDLGTLPMRAAQPAAWQAVQGRPPAELLTARCEAETSAYGVHHAEVSAELLRRWNLPEELVETIRHHHHPERLAHAPPVLQDRAELLQFVEYLTNLDTVVEHPAILDRVLGMARSRYGLPQPALVDFLQAVAPKVAEFASLVEVDAIQCPDFAAILATGCEQLADLALSASLSVLDRPPQVGTSCDQATAIVSRPAPPQEGPAEAPAASPPADALPEFRPEFARDFPEGGCRLDEYELRAPLGRGAMGAVFKAFDPGLGRDLAVKVLLPELAVTPHFRQRFEREARTAAAVRHKNVVAIYRVGAAAGGPYLAMEYVHGQSLQDRIAERGPLSARRLFRTARQIAAALAAAHREQVIHRDVKPGNILLEAGTGVVKVTDFGLAKGIDVGTVSLAGDFIGTPRYMSPEQILGEPVDPRCDLFALGTVLYELSTGKAPFRNLQLVALARAICEAEPEPPRRRRPELPEWFEALILRLLRKDPAERFQSAAEVVALIAKSAATDDDAAGD